MNYAFAVQDSSIPLTSKERAWLKAHPNIQLGTSTQYPPFAYENEKGELSGILVDWFALLSKELDSNFNLYIDGSWGEVQEKAKNRGIDGLAVGAATPKRRVFFTPTNIMMPTYFYVFARSKNDFNIKSLNDLEGMRVGYKKFGAGTENVLSNYKGVVKVPYDDNESMSKALLSKDIDVIVGWVSYDYWRRTELKGKIDNILLITEHPINMVMHIRKDWPELHSILNKAIAKHHLEGLPQILDKWLIKRNNKGVFSKSNLTQKERTWLNKHKTIKYSYDASWAPIEYADKNNVHQGISAAYIKRISEILGIKFEPIVNSSWTDAVKMMADKQIDVLPATVNTFERLKTMVFTKSYLTIPSAIFSATNRAYIGGVTGLYGKKVAVAKDYAIHEWLIKEHPQIDLLPVKDNEAGLKLVDNGKVFAYVGNLLTTSYYIGKSAKQNIRIVGELPFKFNLSLAVRKDWPELASILQKTLDAIPVNEKENIYQDWISIQYEHGFNYDLFWKIIAGILLITLMIVIWNRRLSLEVERRKKVELELYHAKNIAEAASQAKSTFLSSISHDLKTPLAAILGYSELIDDKYKDDQVKIYTGRITDAGNHILDLVSQLLELSKIESGSLKFTIKSYILRDLINDAIAAVTLNAANKGVNIQNFIDSNDEIKIDVDKIRFKQIILNLLSNAIKYNNQNGKVIVDSEIMNSDMLKISITDTGEGMSTEQQSHLFKAYDRAGAETSEIEGTGLGLVISQELVEKMGGTIGFKSELGKGTSFWIQVPLSI